VLRILLDLRPLQNGYANHGIGRYTRELTLALLDLAREKDLGGRLRLEALVLASPPWPPPPPGVIAPSGQPELGDHPSLAALPIGLTCPSPAVWHRTWLWDQIVLGPLMAMGRWHLLHNFAALGPLAQVSVPYLAAPKTLATVHDLHLFKSDAEPVLKAYRHTWRIRLQELSLPRARHLVVDASPIDHELRHHLGLGPGHPVHVIAPGIDHRATTARSDSILPISSKPPYLLAVGDAATKGLLFAAQCVLALRRSGTDITLTIVGKAESARAQIEAAAHAAPPGQSQGQNTLLNIDQTLKEAFTIVANPEDSTLNALYQGATALVFPSTREGFGLPLLEAQAAGCPALALAREPMRSLVAEASHRLPPDTAAWCSAITRLLHEPDWRNDVSLRGRDFATAFTWRKTAEKVLDLWLSST
jgi:glycosyltransferase involved in cell wall biosynthesis